MPQCALETTNVMRRPESWASASARPEVRQVSIRCKIATYNTLSCASPLQRQCLQQFQEKHELAVLGLQECRTYTAPVHQVGYIRRFASQPAAGNLGCQLWFNTSPRFGWVASSFQLAFQHPRLLVVYAKWADCQLAVISGHCPTASAP